MYDDTYAGATTSYFRKVGAKLARSRGRMRRLARYLPGGAPARRFLDIGCNGGFMVEAARELGFTALGVEPDGPAIAFARQTFPHNSFCHGLFETSDLGPEPFDAIYCSEVIEHAADANRFVARIANILKPGGVLYLTTPDIGHWRRPRDIRQWDAFTPPAHCLYFNPDNLTQLLAKHGLRVIRRRLAFKPGIKLFARKI
jgi:2-polyprenyl-3-methyl-5-hydroxy-6-metoxy-1,4-benzoquinol methylase